VTTNLKLGRSCLNNEGKVDILPQESSRFEYHDDFLGHGLMSVIRFRYIDSFNMRYIMIANDESIQHSWEWRWVLPREMQEADPHC
jgi:hypothetical protein